MQTDTHSHRLCRNILLFTFGGTRAVNRANPVRSRHLVLEPLRRERRPLGWDTPGMDEAAVWRMACESHGSTSMTTGDLLIHMKYMGFSEGHWDGLCDNIRKLPFIEQGEDEEGNTTLMEIQSRVTNEMQSFAPEYTEDYSFSNRAEELV